MDYHTLRLALQPPLAWITLNRQADANRIDSPLLRELAEATAAVAATDAIALTVLDASGNDFSLGWDEVTRDELLAAGDAGVVDPFGCIASLACPVLAVVQGAALSAGLELALAADLRICSDDARFGLPEVADGILPLAGGSQRLPRIVGRSRAASMLLLGDELDAAAALTAGLVSRVFPRHKLAEAADALARRIAAQGPIALRYAKEAVHKGLEMPLEHGLRYELDLSIILQTTSDRAEGVRAFLEKRPPNFTGT
ncbi:MAG TPA: enoyl-CoA hydratase-related protein [Dehalococcoidia bacterium]|nr:enoyl-CoA hydratase-related protein [Dehalococcoidia bacterium]